jgi:hypothetical protein
MPILTRRRYPERVDCWQVFYGDVHVGTIARRAGVPVDADQWGWHVGFYPGTDPGKGRSGIGATYDEAKVGFEASWLQFLPTLTEANFQEWRDQRDWTEKKYAMWARGELMPSQKPNSMMRCPCGEMFDSHRLEHTLIHVPHITATVHNETYH